MADPVDSANDMIQKQLEASIKAARGDIPPGKEGECDLCGEHSMRLVNGACAACRDRYQL